MVKRRKLLATFGAVGSSIALAGCSSGLMGGPEYEEGNKEDLLPGTVGDDWPDQDLEPDHDWNEGFDRVWLTPEEDLVVMMAVEIYESVEGAKDSLESAEATASDANDYPLADSAFIWDDDEVARCMFRDSNATGEVLSARESGMELQPDRTRASQYAEILYDNWQ